MRKFLFCSAFAGFIVAGAGYAMAECTVGTYANGAASCSGTNASGGKCGWVKFDFGNGKIGYGCQIARGQVIDRIDASLWQQSQELQKKAREIGRK